MLKHIIINLIFLFSSFIVLSQEAAVKGVIKDSKTGELLVGVNVLLSGNNGTTTDLDGKYNLQAEPGEYRLQISYLGYETISQKVTLQSGQTLPLDFNLRESAKQLDIVTVSGSRYERKLSEETVSIEVLKSDLLQNSNVVTLNEGMDKIAGVVMVDNQITIRGGSGYSFGVGSRVQVMVDDIPLLSVDRNEIRWNFIPIELIDQVEVLKSASSALYGASALNGVVNVRTGFAKDKPETDVLIYTNFYDSPGRDSIKWWEGNKIGYPMRYGGQFSHKQRFGQHDVAVAANFNKSLGFIRLLDVGHRRFSAKYRFRAKNVDGLTMGITANMMDSEEGDYFFWNGYTTDAYIPFGSNGPRDRGTLSLQKRRTLFVDPWITYYDKSGNKHTLRNRFYYGNLVFTSAAAQAYQWYSEYQFQRSFNFGLTVFAGTVAQHSKLNDPSEFGLLNSQNLAGYVQLDYKIKRFNFILGGRYEYYKLDSVTAKRPVGNAGINFQAAKATWLRGNISQGFRFPSIAERFADEELTAGISVLPNPNLKPEYGINAEIGIKQGVKIKDWLGYADASFFWMEYWDMIEYGIDFDLGRLGFVANNISRARIAGYELSLLGAGKVGKIPVRIQSGYTYNYGADLNTDTTLANAGRFTKYFFQSMGTRFDVQETGRDSLLMSAMLKYRFRHLVKFDLEIDLKKVTIGTEVRYYSHVEKVDDIFEFFIPELGDYRAKHNKGGVVYNQRISYDFSKYGKISFIVNNVMNREYTVRPARMEPPRNFTIQYRVHI